MCSFIVCEAASHFPGLQQCHCALCHKSNTPQVFQVTWVSRYCVSYPPVYSRIPQSVHEREREKGGMQQSRSGDLSHSTGGLCRGLLIRERHEEAG